MPLSRMMLWALVCVATALAAPAEENRPAANKDETIDDRARLIPFEGIRECPPRPEKLLNECLQLVANDSRKYLTTGVPELGLDSWDPLRFKEYKLKIGPRVDYILRNVEIHGISNFSKSHLAVNTKRKTLNWIYQYSTPLRMSADYSLETRLLGIFPLWLSGSFEVVSYNFISNDTLFLQVGSDDDGEPNLRISDVVSNPSVSDMHMNISNFRNAGRLGRLVHEWLNRNGKWIFQLIRPYFSRQWADFVKKYAQLQRVLSPTYFTADASD